MTVQMLKKHIKNIYLFELELLNLLLEGYWDSPQKVVQTCSTGLFFKCTLHVLFRLGPACRSFVRQSEKATRNPDRLLHHLILFTIAKIIHTLYIYLVSASHLAQS